MGHFKLIAAVIIFAVVILPVGVFIAKAQQGAGPGAGTDKIVPETELEHNRQAAEQGGAAELQQNAVQGQRGAQAAEPELIKEPRGAGQAALSAGQGKSKGAVRRSRVANAVQEMLKVAERNGGIGQQIRTIAQTQNKIQGEVEDQMDAVKKRSKLKKFFFGPDYKNLNSVADKLANHTEKLEELKQLAMQITNEADLVILAEQIGVMMQVKTELEQEVVGEKKGFSLFGWLNRMLSK